MFMQQKQTAAIALFCNAQGIIRALLYHQLPTTHKFIEGQPFPASMAPGSVEKAHKFFDTLQAQGTALDWEMNVILGEELLGLRFVGITSGRDCLILGAETSGEIMRLSKELKPLNAGLFTALSAVLAQWRVQQKQTLNWQS